MRRQAQGRVCFAVLRADPAAWVRCARLGLTLSRAQIRVLRAEIHL
jgi:hypothetical protein